MSKPLTSWPASSVRWRFVRSVTFSASTSSIKRSYSEMTVGIRPPIVQVVAVIAHAQHLYIAGRHANPGRHELTWRCPRPGRLLKQGRSGAITEISVCSPARKPKADAKAGRRESKAVTGSVSLHEPEKHLCAGYGIGHDILSVDDDRRRRIGLPICRRNKLGCKPQSKANGIRRPCQYDIGSRKGDGQVRQIDPIIGTHVVT